MVVGTDVNTACGSIDCREHALLGRRDFASLRPNTNFFSAVVTYCDLFVIAILLESGLECFRVVALGSNLTNSLNCLKIPSRHQ